METTGQISDVGTAWAMAEMESCIRAQSVNLDAAMESIRTHAADARKAQAALELFKQNLCEKALECAEENGLCDRVERFLDEEMGLGEYLRNDVDVKIEFTVSVSRIGRRDPDEEDIEAAVRDYLSHGLGYGDYEVES